MVDQEKIAEIKEAIKSKKPQEFQQYCKDSNINYNELEKINTELSERGFWTKVGDFFSKIIGRSTSTDTILGTNIDKKIERATVAGYYVNLHDRALAVGDILARQGKARDQQRKVNIPKKTSKSNDRLRIDTTSEAFKKLSAGQKKILITDTTTEAFNKLPAEQQKILIAAKKSIHNQMSSGEHTALNLLQKKALARAMEIAESINPQPQEQRSTVQQRESINPQPQKQSKGVIFKTYDPLKEKIDTTSKAFKELAKAQQNIVKLANALIDKQESNKSFTLSEKHKNTLVRATQLQKLINVKQASANVQNIQEQFKQKNQQYLRTKQELRLKRQQRTLPQEKTVKQGITMKIEPPSSTPGNNIDGSSHSL